MTEQKNKTNKNNQFMKNSEFTSKIFFEVFS